jgi:hypothetical protein
MPCELCGKEAMWIKTCLTTEGSRLLACDPCYEENASILVIVPGDITVTARCDHCWRYGNPREFAEISPGGRKNAYSWTLRRPEGWIVAHFSARGATRETIEQTAWEDHKGAGEEEYP